MIIHTRLEEIYVPMDRMILRNGRAVQVIQIGEKWVEIKSQGKLGYIPAASSNAAPIHRYKGVILREQLHTVSIRWYRLAPIENAEK